MLERSVIHRFSFRQNLVLGADRELVMFAGLMAFAMIFSAQTVPATIYGIALWLISLFLLRLMAKSDPNIRHVYIPDSRKTITRFFETAIISADF